MFLQREIPLRGLADGGGGKTCGGFPKDFPEAQQKTNKHTSQNDRKVPVRRSSGNKITPRKTLTAAIGYSLQEGAVGGGCSGWGYYYMTKLHII